MENEFNKKLVEAIEATAKALKAIGERLDRIENELFDIDDEMKSLPIVPWEDNVVSMRRDGE